MIRYALLRILGAIPTLYVLLTLTFFLLRLAPGGPFDTERAWPPEIQANIDARYGLDRPIQSQYLQWLKDVSRGDLRESFQFIGMPVRDIIFGALPVSAMLG